MLEQDMAARIQAAIEEELGSFRAFADLPATELEAMAARLTRVITPIVAGDGGVAEAGVRTSRAA